MVCYYLGGEGDANVCDHAIPINAGGDVWHPLNHIPICDSCHSKKRVMEKRGLNVPVRRVHTGGLVPVDVMDIINLFKSKTFQETSD